MSDSVVKNSVQTFPDKDTATSEETTTGHRASAVVFTIDQAAHKISGLEHEILELRRENASLHMSEGMLRARVEGKGVLPDVVHVAAILWHTLPYDSNQMITAERALDAAEALVSAWEARRTTKR